MKILWIPAWYPESRDDQLGDFIQRQARAVARFHDVSVIYQPPYMASGPAIPRSVRSGRLAEQVNPSPSRLLPGLPGRAFSAWRAGRILERSIIDHIRKEGVPDFMHVHVPWRIAPTALKMCQRFRIPLVTSEHWSIYDVENTKDHFLSRPRWMRERVRKVVMASDRVLVVSEHLGRKMTDHFPGMKYEVIPNVVDTGIFRPVPQDHTGPFRFLHVSDLAPYKNFPGMLDAVRSFFDRGGRAVFDFIGNLDDAPEKMARAAGLGPDKVRFHGKMAQPELADHMRNSDSFLIFSDTETFSCVTAEALCCGSPVVSSHAGALPELVHEGNGILIPPGNVEALTQALLRMSVTGRNYDREIISMGPTEKFSYDTVGRKLSQVYEEVVNRTGISS